MPTQDASKTREKILSILRMKGPTLPVFISQDTGISMLFASAFLSELLSDKLVKMSHMRVGNSPIYYIPGQETQLERFGSYLKSKEKEAFLLLQEKKFLRDADQPPAIRVALREIKDFAFPFRRANETFWRYLTAKESEFRTDVKPIEEHEYKEARPKPFDKREREIGAKIIKDIDIEEIEEIRKDKEVFEKKKEIEIEIEEEIESSKEAEEKEEYIQLPVPTPEKPKEEHEKEKKKEKEKYEKPEKQKSKEKSKTEKITKKKTSAAQKQDDKFFNKIKEFLSKETIEIINIESFNKNEIHLRIKSEGKEKLLVAYNKRKISDTDIINANKKASQLNLKYVILSMGEPSKKLTSLIEASQNLDKMEKIEK
ncbi:MAG: hypothetical protein ACP5NZ_03445 [Nanobdellota archaeon]